MIALVPLLLAAAPVSGPEAKPAPRPAVRVATATVTIVVAERVTETMVVGMNGKPDRQVREREAMPLVEFF